jgi:hypothetical protein
MISIVVKTASTQMMFGMHDDHRHNQSLVWSTHRADNGAAAVKVCFEVHSLVRGPGIEEGRDLVTRVADECRLEASLLQQGQGCESTATGQSASAF